MTNHRERGFTLIELMCVIVVLGTVLAFSAPSFVSYRSSQNLRSAAINIAAQLRMLREKAIATRTSQTLHFNDGYSGSDYHVHNGSIDSPRWNLPKLITYYSLSPGYSYTMTTGGRCTSYGDIILQDHRGRRDTVSVQLSGLVLHE